jgi:tetratricopeptide (TPR) repeat protein
MNKQNTHKADVQSQITVDEAYKQAIEHFSAERYTEADRFCTAIISKVPNHIDAINLLGIIAQKINRHDLAVDQFQRAINIDNRRASLYYNLGTSLYPLGRLEEVVKVQQKALEIQPNFAEAHHNLGVALKEQGQMEEAVVSYHKAISIKPDYAEAYSNLGNAQQVQGKLEEAITSYQKAISIKPDYADVYSNLGVALQVQGKLEKAVASHQKAVTIKPKKGIYWVVFAQCVKNMNFSYCNEDTSTLLLQMLNQPNVSPQDISVAIVRALKCHMTFSNALEIARSGQVNKNIDYLTEQLTAIPLLLRLMELCIIKDVDVEQLLTQTRCEMLNNISTKNTEINSLPFYVALAMHCFTNDYVFLENEEENKRVEHLQIEVELLISKGRRVPDTLIVLLAAYRPLHNFSWSSKLLEYENLSKDMQKLFERQIEEPLEEQALRLEVPSLTEINDNVSKAVRNQYEVNPYPRWIRTSMSCSPKKIKQLMQDLKLNIDINKQNFPDNPDILDAGCGTGRYVLAERSRMLNCSVLAVDLSLSSLSYAKRKAQEMGVTNIEYLHGDILELKNLTREFDIITSMGVLHHMDDPLQGWKVLVDLLRPNGLMKIGLYSEIARRYIVEVKRVIANKKYTTSHDDIRRCRKDIMNMANKVDSEIVKFNDFFSLSECRDLLFHVQEHRFTLPQIDIALQKLGLRFIGFEMQDSQIMRNFRKTYPEKSATASLFLWNKFEIANPDTFAGMYQFWVQKI